MQAAHEIAGERLYELTDKMKGMDDFWTMDDSNPH